MNRVEFIQSIKDLNNETLLTNFFDQYMILYDLIEKVDDIKVIQSDQVSVSFQLYFTDAYKLQSIVEKLKSQSMLMMYEKYYSISYSDITDSTINIKISLM